MSAGYEQFDTKVKSIYNVKFPPVVDDINQRNNVPGVFSSLLMLVEIQFEIDLHNNIIKLINEKEMVQEMEFILSSKGYNEEFISKFVRFVNENNEVIRNLLSYNEILLYFNKATYNKQGKIYSSYLNRYFLVPDSVKEITGIQKNAIPEKPVELVKLNDSLNFISEYYSVKRDCVKLRWSKVNSRLIKTKIRHLHAFNRKPDSLVFQCTIDNPEDSVVTVLYLDKPYGKTYSLKHIKLDQNNGCKVKIHLPQQALIMFSTKELNHPASMAVLAFYAEPGDTIMLKIENGNDYQQVEIAGTHEEINNILYTLNKNTGLFNYRYLNYQFNIFTTGLEEFIQHDKELEKFRTYLKNNSVHVPQKVISFMKNEITAAKLMKYFFIAKRSYLPDFDGFNTFDEEKLKYAQQKIKDFDLHDNYNDYGYYSRQLADVYLSYYLSQLPRVRGTERSLHYQYTIKGLFFRSELILGGAIFYRTMAGRIEELVTKKSYLQSYTSSPELEEAMVLTNRLINQNYDNHFTDALTNFKNNRLKWENDLHIPEVELHKQNGQKVSLKEIIDGKPTILYISRDWGRHRYYWDELAQKYPQIRFVFIMEGRNLEKWKNYLKQAEPVAEQYLLYEEGKSLENIFLRSSNMYVVYGKDGKLLGYDVDEKKAVELALENLDAKKELNKSQLQLISIILGTALFLVVLLFIFMKWRARQRFQKEQQKRRLRELELTAIRSQMNPHFLFNCLNSVQNLVQQNKGREAHLYLADFAGLIRKVLNNSEKEEVSLAEELEMVKQYLSLEKLRFDFDYRINVDEGVDIHNILIPSMLLQPFAENAVIHGLQKKEGDRQLIIDVNTGNAKKGLAKGIVISIEDNGVGMSEAQKPTSERKGKGVKLVQERLEILQQKSGEKYSLQTFDLKKNGHTGTKVQILIPEE